MMYIHHGSIIQSFTTLKICTLHIHPFLTPAPSNHWSFYCFHGFVFSRMSYGIIQYVDFLDRLFSLSHMHLGFLHVL